MLFTAIFTLLAAIPTVAARDVTSSATRCTTRFGYFPLPTGTAGVPTCYRYTTTTNILSVNYTTCDTVIATPSATTLTDVVTTTATFEVTTISTPVPTTIPTPAGFFPLLAVALPGPTAVSRFKRYDIEGRDANTASEISKRQTAANNTGGFIVDWYGQTSNMYRIFPRRVDCRVAVTINTTLTTTIIGSTETVFADMATATAISTSTVSVTSTVTAILPQRTVYAACQENNIVYSVAGLTGKPVIFDRVLYPTAEGFPIENELIVNTTSAENCCIACQNTAYCAGSFFAPSAQECHLRLTQAPALPPTLPPPYGNSTLPLNIASPSDVTYPTAYNSTHWSNYTIPSTASGVALLPTGTSAAVPMMSTRPSTCAKGSLSMYLGTIQGQEHFPAKYALRFSNGPCGRLSVWPIPVNGSRHMDMRNPPMKRRSIWY